MTDEEASVTGKSRLQSKTYIFNVAVAVLAVAEAKLNILQPSLKPAFYTALSFIVPAVNVALREYTTQPLAGRE